MLNVVALLFRCLRSLLRSRAEVEAENVLLRQQLIVARRRAPKRLVITGTDRLIQSWLCHLWPRLLSAVMIVQPETVVRWHRRGFRAYWRWHSRNRGGRPRIDPELRALIRQMSRENVLWGAPRIHGELLKLGFDVSQSTVAKYMVRRHGPPTQGWSTFIRNHQPAIAAIDLFVVPTIGFRLLYALVGSLRRECSDHALVLGERHLRQLLSAYAEYYNNTRTHLALAKDTPATRLVEDRGQVVAIPVLGGLHHRYARIE